MLGGPLQQRLPRLPGRFCLLLSISDGAAQIVGELARQSVGNHERRDRGGFRRVVRITAPKAFFPGGDGLGVRGQRLAHRRVIGQHFLSLRRVGLRRFQRLAQFVEIDFFGLFGLGDSQRVVFPYRRCDGAKRRWVGNRYAFCLVGESGVGQFQKGIVVFDQDAAGQERAAGIGGLRERGKRQNAE